MKFILSHQGAVVSKFSPDDVHPLSGIMARHLVEYLKATYNFSVWPDVPLGTPLNALPNYQFQSGFLSQDGEILPIKQLIVTQNMLMVICQTTDQADIAYKNIIENFDSILNYRFGESKVEKFYQSTIIVDFEQSIDSHLGIYKSILDIVASAMNKTDEPIIKRLYMGYGDFGDPNIANNITENLDFVIERRAGEAFSKNRYFCSAPLTTTNHIDVMAKIEEAMAYPLRTLN
jgi:hypothetical protein